MSLTRTQKSVLAALAGRQRGCAWNGELGIGNLTTARALERQGFVVVDAWRGEWDTAQKVTKWSVRITDAGRSAVLLFRLRESSARLAAGRVKR